MTEAWDKRVKMKSKIYHRSEPMRDMVKVKYRSLRGRHNQFYAGYTIAELHMMQRLKCLKWDRDDGMWVTDWDNLELVDWDYENDCPVESSE